MKSTIKREITVRRTPRIMQINGKFDLPTSTTSTQEWAVDLKLPDQWSVMVIVGASMSGKSTLAAELFPDEIVNQGDWKWPKDKCIADGFPEKMSIAEITGLLCSVGFSSPPDWKKPYHTLSNGGKFRVDLARTLAERPKRAVIDEFGSLVHEQARNVAAAAASKAVRRRGGQLVALCLYPEAVPYFEPDLVIEIVPGEPVTLQDFTGTDARERLRRPEIKLEIDRCDRSAWQLFRHVHYLNHDLHPSARCFIARVNGEPVAFTAVIFFPHATVPGWREHRTVCSPDYQGIGIGNRVSEFIAAIFRATGRPYYSTTSHPSMIRHRAKSPLWAMTRKPGLTRPHEGKNTEMGGAGSTSRITAGFQYVGPARRDEAIGFEVVTP
jgi:GNAT superfamily N-acetyltransferase